MFKEPLTTKELKRRETTNNETNNKTINKQTNKKQKQNSMRYSVVLSRIYALLLISNSKK